MNTYDIIAIILIAIQLILLCWLFYEWLQMHELNKHLEEILKLNTQEFYSHPPISK